jgi:hypothetical protein
MMSQMAQKRVCLTCKNKGCVAQCRFTKPITERPVISIKRAD